MTRRATCAAVALALVVSGCAAPAPKPPGPVVLRVLMTDDWANTSPFLAAVREFEESHPGVQVQIDKLAIRYMAEAVRSQVEAGTPADIVQWHAYAAGAQGLAEPLDDLWRESNLRDSEFFPGALQDVTWGARRYGVPLDINAHVLFYRADSLASAGFTGPVEFRTFSDLERAADALTNEDGSRRAISIPNSYWHAYGWIRANGGEVVEVGTDGKPRFSLDAPPVVEAVRFLALLVARGLAFAPAGANSSSDAMELFRAGSAALFGSGSWHLATLRKERGGGNIGVTLMPKGTTGQTEGSAMGGSSLFVAKGSSQRALAFEFMELLTNDHFALRFAKEEGRLPVRQRLYDDPFFQDPSLQVFRKQFETAQPLLIDAFPDAARALDQALNDVLSKGKDPAAALQEAQLAAQRSVNEPAHSQRK